MFADASVYGVGLYAVGRSPLLKMRAATLSGISQVLLALGALVEVSRRTVFGSEPASQWMVTIGLVALLANVTCLALIQRHRRGDVNMRAMWICSKNDVLANVGVIATGGLVALTGSPYPDLVIGFAIAFLVGRGGLRILREAQKASYAQADGRTV
jgi:Co/Zn/Cd efflux system component